MKKLIIGGVAFFAILIFFIMVLILNANIASNAQGTELIPIEIEAELDGDDSWASISGGVSTGKIKYPDTDYSTQDKKIKVKTKCKLTAEEAEKNGSSDFKPSDSQLETAKSIAKTLSQNGYNDTAIAGILGNLQLESGGLNPEAVSGDGGHGLAQWTGGRWTDLQKFANSKGKSWKNVRVQTQFLIKELESGGKFVTNCSSFTGQYSYLQCKKSGINHKSFGIESYKTVSSIKEAAIIFCNHYERPASSGTYYQRRTEYAKGYFNALGGSYTGVKASLRGTIDKSKDTTYDDHKGWEMTWKGSLNGLPVNITGVAYWETDDNGHKYIYCYASGYAGNGGSGSGGGNESIADACVAYAYATTNEGKGNKGTPLYQRLHKAIFPGDPYFMSCDRGVATGVRWAGADDSFPAGATGNQYNYMSSHTDKWKRVKNLKDESSLKPGDVLVTPGGGHIICYVGNDAVKKKYKGNNGNTVSASFGTRSPGISRYSYTGHGTTMTYAGDARSYAVFRNIKSESSSKYKNLK